MIRHARRPRPARAAAATAVLPGLVLAVIVGLVWMHALSSGHHGGDAEAPPHGAAVTAPLPDHGGPVGSADPCDGHDSPSDCPTSPPEHPGPLCQSAAVPGAAVVAAPDPGLTALAAPPQPTAVSVATVAGDAGTGSGCGPPSLTLLSISRT